MALDIRADSLWQEVRRAVEHRNSFLGETYWESLRRFCGPAYSDRFPPSEVDFENHAFSWLSVFLPILASGNPRVRGKTPRQGPAAALSKAIELAVNRNFELTDVKRTIEELATDWAFKYCVALTTPMPAPGLVQREDPPYRPTTIRLSLADYCWDPLAKGHHLARFQGHKIIRDFEDLMQEAEEFPERGWDRAMIEKLHKDKTNDEHRKRVQNESRRNEIEYWEVYVPETKLETSVDAEGMEFVPNEREGFHGAIVTVAEECDQYIRPPRSFWGPREGPYTFSGYLYVPDEVVPVSPLVATAAQAEIYNAVLQSTIEAVKAYKRGVAVSSEMSDLAEKLAKFRDLGFFSADAIEDLAKNMQAVEIGGIQPQHGAQVDMLRQLLERASGITEAQLGMASGASTATEASIAQMATGKRMGYMTEKFIQSVVKPIGKKEAWYLSMDPRSRTDLGELAEGMFIDPNTGFPIEFPVLVGGPESGSFIEDNDIEIQPISMRFTSEMLEAEIDAAMSADIATFAPLMPQMPWVDWGLFWSRKAERWGDPSMGKIVDVQKAMMMGQLQMMMTMGMVPPGGAPMTPTATPPQGRLGIDMKGQKGPPALKSSEKPTAFSGNARPATAGSSGKLGGQKQKAPRAAGMSATTK